MVWQLILMNIPVGKLYNGPKTEWVEAVQKCLYRDNGLTCFWISMATVLALLVLAPETTFDGLSAYYNLGKILMTLDIFGLVFCLLLFLKGWFFTENAKNRTDEIGYKRKNGQSLSALNYLELYYNGIETYPHLT